MAKNGADATQSFVNRQATSCLLRHFLAEEALRAEHEHQEQHHEGVGILVGNRDVVGREALDYADENAADDCTLDVAEAADDGCGKSLERDDRTHANRNEQHRSFLYATATTES